MSQSLPRPENKLHYPALDGLRAVAVAMVFMQHFYTGQIPALTNWGWTGVDIFFVLSGFLITGILYDTRNTEQRYRNFYMRRTLRIFPLYYGVLLVCLVAGLIDHWKLVPGLPFWATYTGNFARFIYIDSPLYRQGAVEHMMKLVGPNAGLRLFTGHFWSLCVEEQFYLIWPFVVYTIRDRVKLRNICAAACIIVPLLRIVAQVALPSKYLHEEILYRLTPFRVDALLMGGLVALCLRGPEADRLKKLARPAFVAFFLALATGLALFAVLHGYAFVPYQGKLVSTIGLSLLDVGAALIILRAIDPSSSIYKPLTRRPLLWLGTISYGLYVFHDLAHPFLLGIAGGIAPNHRIMVTSLLGIVWTITVATLSFYLYESPFLRLKKYFAPKHV